ncbi:unnamed protein product [Chrysoparadoxa australica]
MTRVGRRARQRKLCAAWKHLTRASQQYAMAAMMQEQSQQSDLQARRAGMRSVVLLVGAAERSRIACCWRKWVGLTREAEVLEARRQQSVSLVLKALTSASHRGLRRLWREWVEVTREMSQLELRRMEGGFYLAQVLLRVGKRNLTARARRAWQLWSQEVFRQLQGQQLEAQLAQENIQQQLQRQEYEGRSQRSSAVALAGVVVRLERKAVSGAWRAWREMVESFHEAERAAHLRRQVSARLLLGAMASVLRKDLSRAWRVWTQEVRAMASSELMALEGMYYMAQVLDRVSRRHNREEMRAVWQVWTRYAGAGRDWKAEEYKAVVRLEQEKSARLVAERAAKLEADAAVQMQLEAATIVELERAARLKAEEVARLEAERAQRLEEEAVAKLEAERAARVEVEKQVAEKKEAERLLAERLEAERAKAQRMKLEAGERQQRLERVISSYALKLARVSFKHWASCAELGRMREAALRNFESVARLHRQRVLSTVWATWRVQAEVRKTLEVRRQSLGLAVAAADERELPALLASSQPSQTDGIAPPWSSDESSISSTAPEATASHAGALRTSAAALVRSFVSSVSELRDPSDDDQEPPTTAAGQEGVTLITDSVDLGMSQSQSQGPLRLGALTPPKSAMVQPIALPGGGSSISSGSGSSGEESFSSRYLVASPTRAKAASQMVPSHQEGARKLAQLVTSVLRRQGLTIWCLAARDIALEQAMKKERSDLNDRVSRTLESVKLLKRQQKLRLVMVSSLRRATFGLQRHELGRAMVRWSENCR